MAPSFAEKETKAQEYISMERKYINMPCLVGKRGNLDTDTEDVEVAVALPGGTDIESVEVSLNSDGRQAELRFDWPKGLYDMNQLYSRDIKEKRRVEAKILSMKDALKSHRIKSDDIPRSTIIIPLPVQVHTDSKTWIKTGKIDTSGEIIAIITFTAYQKEYDVIRADKRIKFTVDEKEEGK